MSQDRNNVMNSELKMSTINRKIITTTPNSKCKTSTPVNQMKSEPRKKIIKKPIYGKIVTSIPIKKRSLTMIDIRNKSSSYVRTPIKPMKQDSCSTTDNSPRPSDLDVHPAEQMFKIHQRELQIRTFARLFHYMWRKNKHLAENLEDEVDGFPKQKLCLKTLRDKESERRDEITKLAEKQKAEIIDLTEELSQLHKEHEILKKYFERLVEEYIESVEYVQTSSTEFDIVHDENQKVIVKVQEVNDWMLLQFVNLNQMLRKAEEIDKIAHEQFSNWNFIKKQRTEAINASQKMKNTNEILLRKLKNNEETEKNLKETIKELRESVEISNLKNKDLKSEIKNMHLQLESAEQQLEEQKLRPEPWNILVRKVAIISMFFLLQVGLLPMF